MDCVTRIRSLSALAVSLCLAVSACSGASPSELQVSRVVASGKSASEVMVSFDVTNTGGTTGTPLLRCQLG